MADKKSLTCLISDNTKYLEMSARHLEVNYQFQNIRKFENPREALTFFKELLVQKNIPYQIMLDINLEWNEVLSFIKSMSSLKNPHHHFVEFAILNSGKNMHHISQIEKMNIRSEFKFLTLSLDELKTPDSKNDLTA